MPDQPGRVPTPPRDLMKSLRESLEEATGRVQSLTEMRAFEGKHVEITLDYDDPAARVEGHLLYITDDGEVAYVNADDKTMHGWPCLAVKEKP